jgi:hypothetical protein
VFARNHISVRHLATEALVERAARLGCPGVEGRHDLCRPPFDGMNPATMGRDEELWRVGLGQVNPFDAWEARRRTNRHGALTALVAVKDEAQVRPVPDACRPPPADDVPLLQPSTGTMPDIAAPRLPRRPIMGRGSVPIGARDSFGRVDQPRTV